MIALENARFAQGQELAIERYIKALDKWDVIRWEDTGIAKHNAAAELGDALTALKALVR